MAPSPAPPAAGSPPGKGKPLSLRNPWSWVIIGGIALAGGAFILYRNRKNAASSSSGGSSSGTSPDYSGALGTLQDEIGNLQSAGSGAGAGGAVAVPVTGTTGTDTSGGGGSVTPSAGPSSGGNSSGASGGDNSTSSSGDSGTGTSTGTDSGGGTATATQEAPAPYVTNERILSLTNVRATVAWDGPGASQWDVVRVGPGSPNGITNRVYAPVAVYSGLASGHNYEIRIYPVVNGQRAGSPGGIDFKTK